MTHSNKHENYEILNLIGYGLAKFNNSFIREFGFNTKTSFYIAMVECGIAETESVLKNRQDLFDPFFDNNRKGWWQKGDAYIHRKHFIDSLFGTLSVNPYAKVVKMYLQKRFRYTQNEVIKIEPIIKSQFKQLQKTGLEAEMYFFNNYQNIKIFNGGIIEDARLLGDGYDFQIEINNDYFLAEVKGVRQKRGAIRLTHNEYNMAIKHRDKYILSIISNLSHIPKITIFPDPVKQLKFNKTITKQEQITFNTNSITWGSSNFSI